MTFPVDPTRKTGPARRVKRSAGSSRAQSDRQVPAIYEPAPPPAITRAAARPEAAFAAHLLGQEGQRRGLRGGKEVLDSARTLYNKIEYSGPADRRAPKGGAAKTEV